MAALLLLAGCGADAPRASSAEPSAPLRLWIAGDVQISAPSPARLAALAALPGLGIVNLEGPVGRTDAISAERLANHPSTPARLAQQGVAVIGVANNHQRDRGAAGIEATRRAIEAAGARVADRGAPALLEVGGRVVRVVAGEIADVAAMGAALAAPADLRIASLHVLAPPSYLPAPATREAVATLVAAGADVVAVHGSHALGPVTREGDAIVAWGVGNLAFDCRCTREDEAMALGLTLGVDGLTAQVIALRAGLHGAPVARHPDAAGVLGLLQALDSAIDAAGSVAGVGAQPDGDRDDVRR